jgi:5'-nucleotidase/2',3'-cyclic-nucleotide 2'-phosphodiesterase/3'-nucleotidase/5'-nucleotidase
VHFLYCHGAISGYADYTFRPFNNTTRAQLSKIVVLAEGWPLDCPQPGHFSDVPPGSPFFCYVETAYSRGVISGYADGTFRPGSNVTRGQTCKVVALAEGWPLYNPPAPTFGDVPPGDPFYAYIETAHLHNVISGYADGTFRPGASATRGQICKVIYLATVP